MLLKEGKLKGAGFDIPVTLEVDDDGIYTVAVDDVVWLETEVQHHAVVMFHMIMDHITEYMHYERR